MYKTTGGEQGRRRRRKKKKEGKGKNEKKKEEKEAEGEDKEEEKKERKLKKNKGNFEESKLSFCISAQLILIPVMAMIDEYLLEPKDSCVPGSGFRMSVVPEK